MSVRQVDTATFTDLMARSDHLVVDFFAPWCAPCRTMAPHFERVARANQGVDFIKVDTDEEQTLAALLEIRSLPTVMVFRQGVLLCTEVGAQPPAALRALVSKTANVDMAEVHAAVRRERLSASESELA